MDKWYRVRVRVGIRVRAREYTLPFFFVFFFLKVFISALNKDHMCLYRPFIFVTDGVPYRRSRVHQLFFYCCHHTYCSANLSTFFRGNLKSVGLANTCRTAENSSYYCFCPKMAPEATSEHLISKHFLGEHPPRPP